MSEYTWLFLSLFAITTVIGIITVRFSIFLSHKTGILDRPDPRKAHREPIAYLGGLGMLLAFLAGFAAFVFFQPSFTITHQHLLMGVLIGSIIIFCVGFWDDVRPIRPVMKLFLQIAVASFMWFWGVQISRVSVTGDSAVSLAGMISYLITVGWYVGLMNAVNLVDGLDGLAGGICFLGAASLVGVGLVIGFTPEVLIGAALAAIIAGTTLGFLFHNWHPAKTFMGDGGSLLLGFLLATASLVGSTKTPTLLALSVPLIALGLPLFETAFSFIRRAATGKSPFKADRLHLHHRLLDLGLDQHRVVISLLFITAILGVNSIVLAQAGLKILFFNVLLLVAGIILLIENLNFLEKKRIKDSESRTANMVAPASEPEETATTKVAPVAEQQLL